METSSKTIALITGANKGIGFEVARQLGARGCTVLLGARNSSLGQTAAAKLQSEGVDARFLELDLERPETMEAAAASIAGDFQQLDILINNAGIADKGDGAPSTASVDA